MPINGNTFYQSASLNVISGVATSGMPGALVDTSTNYSTNMLDGKLIKVSVDNIDYYRTVLTTTGNMVTFDPLESPSSATVELTGSGEDIFTGGVVIRAKNVGASGNNYSIELVSGVENSTSVSASFADNVITITSGVSSEGVVQDIMAGDIDSLITNTPEISDLFETVGDFTAGGIEITEEPVSFTGGSDGISVVEGTEYVIFMDIVA
jgi:hypothetical protein